MGIHSLPARAQFFASAVISRLGGYPGDDGDDFDATTEKYILLKAKNKADWEKALKRLGRTGGSGAYVTGGSKDTDGIDGEDHVAD